ncbi:MAG: insulinase family protein [Candidatus Levybacteria bacterium]|nr:insulinase family protein [Candidatus Levybacteria bacterium]
MQYHKTVLSNGLRVLTIPMPSFESATVLVMVGAGSRYETKDNNGISHFLEHMAFKGTKKRPSAIEISTLIDGIGGEFNAFTGKETTGYYIKSGANHINLSLDVLSDMLQNMLLSAKEIDKERGVILEEINLYEDTPARKIGDVFESLLYGNTPMGWDIAGEKDVIRKITRSDFLVFMGSLYSANNLTVVVAGGIDSKKTFILVEQYFGRMNVFATNQYEPVVQAQEKPQVFIKHKKTEQVHIALGVRTVAINSPDRYPLALLSAILGGGMSSRLFHEVREKRGLGYYVRTNADEYQDCGSLVTMAGIDPKRVDEAITVILDQYHGISSARAADLISNDELKKAKEYIKGHLILEMEDSRSVASFYASQELLEKHIDNLDDVLLKIDKVTKEEVSQVAKKYLKPTRLNLAVIGNFDPSAAGKSKFEKLLWKDQ